MVAVVILFLVFFLFRDHKCQHLGPTWESSLIQPKCQLSTFDSFAEDLFPAAFPPSLDLSIALNK